MLAKSTLQRPVEMNVALTGLDLKHIYDGKIYEIDIVSKWT